MSKIIDFIKENFMALLGGLIIVLLLLSAVHYWQAEKVTQVRYQLKDISKINSFYASELLLKAQNKQKRKVITQLDMDLLALVEKLKTKSAPSALIIRQMSENVTEKNAQAILGWVQKGGHLITFNKNAGIEYSDWRAVEKRLQAIKKQLKLDKNKAINQYNPAFSKAINSDSELQTELAKLKQQQGGKFWQKLDIYLVNNKDHDYDKINKQVDNIKEIATNNKQKNNQIRDYIKDFYYGEGKVIVNNNADNALYLIQGNPYRSLYSELLFANNPTINKRDDYQPPTANYIRHYLTKQLNFIKKQRQQHKKALKKLAQANKQHNHHYFTLAEQQQTLEILLKLSDSDLLAMFADLDKQMLDLNYGKGRITVLQNSNMFSNPRAYELDNIEERDNFYHNGKLPIEWRKKGTDSLELDIFIEEKSLYANDHSLLLTSLTENSGDIWLFGNIDIDPLPIMLWKKARLAVLGFGLLLVIWLWSLYNNFGKTRLLVDNNSVDIFRYFIQIGRYGWGYDHGYRLTRLSQQQTVTLAKKYLAVHDNSDLNIQHIELLSGKLQQLLQQKLAIDDPYIEQLRNNKALLMELLDNSLLQQVLLTDDNYFTTISDQQFTRYTQCMWLIKWLIR